MSQHSIDSSSSPLLPAGFVERDEAARISGLGITAWKRWEAQGKVTFGKWLMLPWGGKRRIFPVEAIQQMMRELDLSFPPPGTVDRHEAARMLGVSARTFSTWEKEGRITCGRLVSVPGQSGQRKVYPIEELRPLKEQWDQQKEQLDRRLEPYPDPDQPGVVRVPVASTMHPGMEAMVDADVLSRVQGKRWNWSSGGTGRSKPGSVVWSGSGVPLARIVLGVTDPVLLVSHRNGDGLDCRRENLIVRTRSEARLAARPPRKWEGLEPYLDPDRPGVVRVPICTQEHKGMEALIDAADLPLVQEKRWNWSPGHSGQPGSPGGGTVMLAIGGTPKPSLPRILLGINSPDQLVCHRNGDRLDCRRENLIVRTRSQVRRAAKKMLTKAGRACSSRFKGVTRTDSGRKWSAMINIDKQSRYLGVFRSEIDAALAYDAALRERQGQDTTGLNFPDPAEAERLRSMEPVAEIDPIWPPPGMVDRHEACAMFGVSLRTWTCWEKRGRITCGQYHPMPNDKPGQCKLYPREELERAQVEIEKLGKPYADPDRPGVWRVPLKGYLTYREALIDEADLPIVHGHNWNWTDRTEGRVEGNVILASTTNAIPLARLIMGAQGKDVRVCYVNGDPLDCRRANLSVLTQAEQVQGNRKMGSVSGRKYSSAYKGVSWDALRGKWLSQIRKGTVGKHLGRFDSEIDAATAYDAAARVLFGEHGHLNFPDQTSTEQALAAARAALDSAVNKRRAERRRQRDMERKLRQAAAKGTQAENAANAQTTVISFDVARQLFDVAPSVWQRWQRLGWLPACVKAGDGEAMCRLAEIERLLLRCGIVALPYPDPQLAGVYRVPLSGETAQGREALIDADAVPLVQTRRWRFAFAIDMHRAGEVQTMDPSENSRLHQVVMGISGREWRIGFRNGDPLDCRRKNLIVRDCSDMNAGKRKSATFCGRPCTSRFKGVCWDTRRERWLASITKERVQKRLGSFRDEIAAAQAYDEAARELFGEHARLNFPDGVDARLEAEAEPQRQEDAMNNAAPDAAGPDQARAA